MTRVLAIVGLTGTGKTELACAVARRSGAEIISADSMQVYRGMDIGTAKPAPRVRAEIPHHGVDVVDPDEPMSAGRFARLAREAARGIEKRGRPIVLCGGTGLYARAFAGGLVGGVESEPGVRAALEARDTDDLRRELERADPEAARRIQPNDRVRTVRALEVQRLGARPLSEQHDLHGFGDRPFEVRWLGLALEREALWARLRVRVEAMYAHGLVDEVRRLRAAGYGPELRPMNAIGYREAGRLLDGRLGAAEALEATFTATRRYARRQRTWFRAEPGLAWVDASRGGAALDRALRALLA
jgi:tRNA dimethylallyltransferase